MKYKFIILILTIMSYLIFSNTIVAISSTNSSELEIAQNTTGVVSSTSSMQPNLNPTSHERILLIEGKNTLTTPISFRTIYVKDFIKNYPQIEVISYKENNDSIGFINIMNGIGQNFILYPESEYEIITKQNITIQIT